MQVPADLSVRVQREDLDEMIGNLLDNACKWARTRVIVAASQAESAVEITVDDDGSGLADEMREAVLQRGVRADEAAPGSGLGLAIVRDLAEVYGGSVSLEAAPLGGVRARSYGFESESPRPTLTLDVPELEVRRLGVVPYTAACAMQRALVEERRAGRVPDLLLLLEHPHVITLGVKADAARSHLIATPECWRRGRSKCTRPAAAATSPITDPDRSSDIRSSTCVRIAAMCTSTFAISKR